MDVRFLGSDPILEYRRRLFSRVGEADAASDPDVRGTLTPSSDDRGHGAGGDGPRGTTMAFIGTPVAERFEAAADALRGGAHVFVEWPPAPSIEECARLVRLSEEAGLEAGVSRPLRSAFESDIRRARVILLERSGLEPIAHALADVIDLASYLVGSASVRSVDAEADYDASRSLRAAAVSLRFHNGALAQAVVRRASDEDRVRLYAAGDGQEIEQTIAVDDDALLKETNAAFGAIREGRPIPVSAHDALQTLRTVERVMGLMR